MVGLFKNFYYIKNLYKITNRFKTIKILYVKFFWLFYVIEYFNKFKFCM